MKHIHAQDRIDICAYEGMMVQALMAPHSQTTEEISAPAAAGGQSPVSFEDLLVKTGREKDRDAFIRLFEYYAPRIKGFYVKGGMEVDTADELAQETMLSVWDRAETYNPKKANANTWIFTIARNKKIDYWRKNAAPDEGKQEEPLLMPETPPDPEERYDRTEEAELIKKALDEIPPEQAALLYKSFFEGKTHKDIAKEETLPLGTVKSRIRLALDRMRHILGKETAL